MENGFQYVKHVAKSHFLLQSIFYCTALALILLDMCYGADCLCALGVDFYKQFTTLSPSDQVNALFSGFYGLVQDDNDRIETLKIFLKTLKLLQWHLLTVTV